MSKTDNTEEWDDVVSESEAQNETEEEIIPEAAENKVEDLDEVASLKEEVAKEKDKFLRLFAEFENYKKRTTKERIDLFRTAGQEVIASLLPVLDDFDRALKELSKSEDKNLFTGIELISNKLNETLKNKGLKEVAANPGDAFNADMHEAITQIPAPNKKMKGKIIDVVEKGFMLGDKIIRHPKVVVGN
ncbi:nucleotide exchange factor GrpE [Arenibacter sp. GZD96]|uniref:nucleotide exchange factor GrpE n=1 Tax=Aurantibrevibacter litoralis TaxID=3106030 RepID=UPI002AFEFFE9|nr:nucleotide exchange factor GrpE [Arenibacter sp. GZD-96]MEA1787042.1 nucleotide exchange factor GrpE [Arenibacter sp. GZD-96]